MEEETAMKEHRSFPKHRDPVTDGSYIAQLVPNGAARLKYKARIIAPIGTTKPVRSGGVAYLRVLPWRHRSDYDSTLTQFLKAFCLYKRGMTEKQRIEAARKFVATRPYVSVGTVWVGYSHKKRKTVLSGMHRFRVRPDGSHNPVVVIDGEMIRATAHVKWCLPLYDLAIQLTSEQETRYLGRSNTLMAAETFAPPARTSGI